MMAKGRNRQPKGEANANAKLTSDQVRVIRADKRTQVEIALAFDIRQANVSAIKLRKTWRHVG